jgi:RHS repeat-associated protein
MRFNYADGRMPVSMTYQGNTYYLAYDQIGSPIAVTDSTGNLVKKIDYDSFGNIIFDSNPSFPIPFSFAGGLQDRDTNLIRFGARDYDPTLGRWTAKDPIDFAGRDTNLYGYVMNDPVNFVDSFGLLNDTEIANIIFNETRSLSGPNIEQDRENLAHAIINGYEAIGNNRPRTAPTTANVPLNEQSIHTACRNAVTAARNARERGVDPTSGAMNFNFRNTDSVSNFLNLQLQTQIGPLNNSYLGGGLNATGVYANTYGRNR